MSEDSDEIAALDPATAKMAVQAGQAASGLIKKGGGVIGGGLALVDGVLDANAGIALLEAQAKSLGLSLKTFLNNSEIASVYHDQLDAAPVTATAKFGASAATSGIGSAAAGASVGAAVGSVVPVVGTLAGSGIGALGGLVASTVTAPITDAAVDAAAGIDPCADECMTALTTVRRGEVSAGDVFKILQSQLPQGERDTIQESIDTAGTDPATLVYQYGDSDVMRQKAKALLKAVGMKYDADADENACEQIAEAINAKHLPPVILLIDDAELKKVVKGLPKAGASEEAVSPREYRASADDVIPFDGDTPSPNLPRGKGRIAGRSAA